MNYADRIIEIIAIDRHARMARLDEGRQNLFKGRGNIDGNNVGARGHDVIDAQGLKGLGLIDNIDGPIGCSRTG